MSQKEREVLEKIAQVMESLPSENLLEKCWTEEQKEEWYKRRKWNILIAKAWREECNLIKGDCLGIALKNQEIDKLEQDGIELLIDYYNTLWEIVKIVEPYIDFFHSFLRYIVSTADCLSVPLPKVFIDLFLKKLRQEYLFTSPYGLFSAILKENENNLFSVCLKPYQEIYLTDAQKGSKLVEKFLYQGMKDGCYYQPNDDEFQQLKKYFSWEDFYASWQNMTLMVGQLAIREKLLTKNEELLLKEKFEEFNKLAMETCRLNGTASRKRKSKTWDKRRSVAWKNGKKAYAEGGVYNFP